MKIYKRIHNGRDVNIVVRMCINTLESWHPKLPSASFVFVLLQVIDPIFIFGRIYDGRSALKPSFPSPLLPVEISLPIASLLFHAWFPIYKWPSPIQKETQEQVFDNQIQILYIFKWSNISLLLNDLEKAQWSSSACLLSFLSYKSPLLT